ncbi:MAG: hypothetical protein ABS944_16235 [Solibacillus sp.]|uniref:hypothetical protein n=1 Tax=Solibacillus sp. TaxID=1909654 RepID=UPI003315B5CB
MQLYRLRFKTAHKTAEDIKKDYSSNPPSIELLEQIAESYRNLDGAEAVGAAWEYSPDSYSIYAVEKEADEMLKEFTYLQEQDELFGNYINDREQFNEDWANEKYEAMGAMHFDRTDFEVLEELKIGAMPN